MPRTALPALAVALLALSLASPTRAHAQTFTVLPVERDSRASESERASAFQAVREARVLGPAARFEAVGTLAERLPEEQRGLTDCLEVDCAAALARAANLDAVLVIAVWPDAEGRAQSVAVTIVDPDGHIHEADAEVGEQGVSQAATHALVQAARNIARGDGVELRVYSTPEGALVLVDDTEVGVTPYVGSFAEGDHRVIVRLEGNERERVITLESEPVTIDVALGGNGGGDGSNGDPNGDDDSVHWVHTVGPLVVGALGLSAAGMFFYGIAAEGCDGAGPMATCRRPVDGAITAYAVAAPLLLAGAIFWWFFARSGDDDEVPADRPRASLLIGPGSLGLDVSF